MKTIILTTLILSCLAFNTNSQTCFGVDFGINQSGLNVNTGVGTETRTGIHGGIFIEAEASENAALQFGINYTQRGNKYTNNIVALYQKMHYIEFPFAVNIKFPAGKFVPYFDLGMYYATMISSKQTEEYNTGEYYEDNTWDAYIGGDFGVILGAGLNYKLSKSVQAFTSVNYYYGFTNIIEEYQYITFDVSNYGTKYGAGIKLSLE